MGFLEQIDIWLFRFLNSQMVHPALDDLMLFLTSPKQSLHIFFLIMLFMVVRRGWNGVAVVFLALLAVGLSDFVASGIFKPLFQRLRPCHDLEGVRLLIRQAHTWSFASSHAANSTAIASMSAIFFWHGATVDKAFTVVMFLYALLVSFSRIYIGVHYPGDVLGGMVIGIASAILIYTIAAWITKRFIHGVALRSRVYLP